MSWFLFVIIVVGRILNWVLHPIQECKQILSCKRIKKLYQEQNINQGKNPDGSFFCSFPPVTLLNEALREIGFELGWHKDCPESVVGRYYDTPLGQLNSQQIAKAVTECQVATW